MRQPPLTAAPTVLRTRLASRGMSQADFARRMGRSAKVVSEALRGLTTVTPLFALHCELVLGLRAWEVTEPQMLELLARAREAQTTTSVMARACTTTQPPEPT